MPNSVAANFVRRRLTGLGIVVMASLCDGYSKSPTIYLFEGSPAFRVPSFGGERMGLMSIGEVR